LCNKAKIKGWHVSIIASILRPSASILPRRDRSVLVAIDRQFQLILIQEIVDRLGARGVFVRSVAEACERCASERFDAIVVAASCEDAGSLAKLRTGADWTGTVPIICMASGATLDAFGDLCEARVTLVLPEPTSAPQLAAALLGALALNAPDDEETLVQVA
jgi:CheY-like chemotaxis protein